jgi:uncharacterized protein YbbK (DUF523 family)
MSHKPKSTFSFHLFLKNEYSFITLNFKCVNDYFYKSGIILYGFVMKRILISACLAGDRVRYDGKRVPLTHELLRKWSRRGLLVKVCPEVSGGLKIPRPPAQIVDGSGREVLDGTAKVVNIEGKDVSLPFIRGAEYALSLSKKYDIQVAILKEKSPSCGVHHIYDGHFVSNLIPGCGVTTAMLRQSGLRVFSENELDLVISFLKNKG